ncbi:AAA family ATPase [Anaerolineales bacterium HSG6]|nr:AAA family ATPase [Anaerolineales bacterium HSG6]
MKLKFPYGYSNFETIINDGHLFIDRTAHIHQLEETGRNILFLRPRRFGKSLFLSILENYYDVAKADRFEELFGQLAIGQNPTPSHNQYFVLKWDFSKWNFSSANSQGVQRSLHDHINNAIKEFLVYYQSFLEVEINQTDAFISFQSLITAVRFTPYQLYLLVDEYDSFANELMRRGSAGQQQLFDSEGLLRYMFKVIKGKFSSRGLTRIFMTGVLPMVKSDMGSGHLIAHNIYFEPEFNDLCGFHETEVEQMVQQVTDNCGLSAERAVEMMDILRAYYGGYRFVSPFYKAAPTDSNLYNPTLILYFLKYFQEHCDYPHTMLDSNLAPDRRKIEYVAQLSGGPELVQRAVNEQEPLSVPKITGRFEVQEMLEAENDDTLASSLLYYLGMLTFEGGITPMGRLKLRIPNLTIRGLYFERLQKILLPNFNKNELEKVAKTFYTTGNLQPTCDLIEARFNALDNRDYRTADEFSVKVAFLSVLFNNIFYLIDSETELQRGYADLTMIIRPDMRQYQLLDHVIEFKYLKLSETELSGAEVRALSEDELRALPKVQAKLNDADSQLSRYQHGLYEIYGDKLRLQNHTVVSVGFERVVWTRHGEES